MNHLSGNVSFLFSSGYFHIFSDASADFSVLPRILFCIFPSAYEKSAAFFHPDHPFSEIFSLRRDNFSCLFMWSWENFLSVSIIFLLSRNFFKRKICFFFVSVIGFSGMSFLTIRIFFKFFRGKLRNFSARFDIFCASPEFFQKKNPLFSAWISLADDPFFPSSGSISGFFSCHPIKNSILPEYFSSHPAGIFTVPDLFRTNQTRAHLHVRNNILSTPPSFLFLIPQNLP